jgi:hypothetical protein
MYTWVDIHYKKGNSARTLNSKHIASALPPSFRRPYCSLWNDRMACLSLQAASLLANVSFHQTNALVILVVLCLSIVHWNFRRGSSKKQASISTKRSIRISRSERARQVTLSTLLSLGFTEKDLNHSILYSKCLLILKTVLWQPKNNRPCRQHQHHLRARRQWNVMWPQVLLI